MQRILLVANDEKPAALALAEEAAIWLAGRADVVGMERDPEADLEVYRADIVVIFGGDGTVLRAVPRLGKNPPPLLTVNLGRLGYLAEVNPETLAPMLERVLAGQYRLSERMILHGQVMKDGTEIWHGHAVNEFVLAPATPGRLIEIEVEVDGRFLMHFAGDGLIVASPTGSTAYSLSAGGPIVSPELRAMLLVPICPHHLANRPLVMRGDEVLRVRHLGNDCARFASDGREPICLDPSSSAEIRASGRVFRLILTESTGRYDILRDKLGWGGKASPKL